MNFNDIKDIKDLQQMLPTDPQDAEGKMRIIQELVPGKQITLAHVIGGPRPIVYKKLGLNPDVDYGNSAIGILNMSPPESAVIASETMETSSRTLARLQCCGKELWQQSWRRMLQSLLSLLRCA